MALKRDAESLYTGSPFSNFRFIDITFPTTANTDCIVKHDLVTDDPEGVLYIPLNQSAAGGIYNDQSATRKLWGTNYIILRSSVASLQAKLLLATER